MKTVSCKRGLKKERDKLHIWSSIMESGKTRNDLKGVFEEENDLKLKTPSVRYFSYKDKYLSKRCLEDCAKCKLLNCVCKIQLKLDISFLTSQGLRDY